MNDIDDTIKGVVCMCLMVMALSMVLGAGLWGIISLDHNHRLEIEQIRYERRGCIDKELEE